MEARLSDSNIKSIEHELLSNLEYWDLADGNMAEKSMTYISGIVDMANAVLRAIKDGNAERRGEFT